ncbi:hypothetical protein [Streptomyces smyrnaeus]|uniref:hypothetical protein n=1 Tax=Streptomyces smyrnaeus TaxID=1387713 RepID=UPI00369BBC36
MTAAVPDLAACREPGLGTGVHLVRDPALQEVTRTASRQLRHGADLRAAARWMVRARLHPDAGEGTIRVADDFADRMHRNKHGHVAYCLDQMAVRLGRSRSWVAAQVRILRELGLLAWVEHGSALRNALRTRHGDQFRAGMGFRRTATIYAPCAPPVWDRARGHRLRGRGYTARVVGVTEQGRALAVRDARAYSACGWTPSVAPTPTHRSPQAEGKKNYTRRRATAAPRPTSSTRSPAQVAVDVEIARRIRPRVRWTQRAGLRQLAFALRPLIDQGLGEEDIVATLMSWSLGWDGWRPRRPAAVIIARLRNAQQDNHRAKPTRRQEADPCPHGPYDSQVQKAWGEAVRVARRAAERFEHPSVPAAVQAAPQCAAAWSRQEAVRIRETILASLAYAEAASRRRLAEPCPF